MHDHAAQAEKREMRKRLAARAAALSSQYRTEADESIRALLLHSAVYRRASSLFVYISMEGEPSTRGIMESAWAAGKRVYVPKCHGKGQMDAVRITGWDALSPGCLGIPEPRDGEALGTGEGAALCLIPCVSAARDGTRLGHGAGYYDRWLAAHGGKTVCLCYEEMLSPRIPAASWDKKMDAVLTEKGFYPTVI